MFNTNDIMNMLDWNNDLSVQERGRRLAKDIECINIFFQPMDRKYNKNVWDNCALILFEKADEELRPYLDRMLEWLIDMNWPGAEKVYERLAIYGDRTWLIYVIDRSIEKARALQEDTWHETLVALKKGKTVKECLAQQ